MAAADITEAELLRRAREGDEEAFVALFERHAAALRGRVRQWLSPAVQRKVSVCDVLQEAHLVALRRFAEFEDRGEGSLGRWLGQIAELQARAVVRKLVGTAKRDPGREVSRGARPDTRHFVGKQATPSQHAIAGELKEKLQRVLAELPEDYREVLRLLQEEDVTIDEAAVRMERSVAAVRKLYGRALTRLGELMDSPDRRGSS